MDPHGRILIIDTVDAGARAHAGSSGCIAEGTSTVNFQVYVAVPQGVTTGGPEALHQLVHALRSMGVDAALWPVGRTRGNLPSPEYARYECPTAEDWPLSRHHTAVVPETSPRELLLAPLSKKWTWWLSVDNSSHPRVEQMNANDPPPWLPDQAPYRHRGGLRSQFQARLSQLSASAGGFMFQSAYARDFGSRHLSRGGFLVTDYLRDCRYPEWRAPAIESIAYNRSKGQRVIDLLRPHLPTTEFTPISDMPHGQVLSTLSANSMYLEVGNLPGRDRLPREAARVGCPIVILARGAGAYEEDFPHLERFRVPCDRMWLPGLVGRINEVLADPVAAALEQRGLREWVSGDRERFQREVALWWGSIEKASA